MTDQEARDKAHDELFTMKIEVEHARAILFFLELGKEQTANVSFDDADMHTWEMQQVIDVLQKAMPKE